MVEPAYLATLCLSISLGLFISEKLSAGASRVLRFAVGSAVPIIFTLLLYHLRVAPAIDWVVVALATAAPSAATFIIVRKLIVTELHS